MAEVQRVEGDQACSQEQEQHAPAWNLSQLFRLLSPLSRVTPRQAGGGRVSLEGRVVSSVFGHTDFSARPNASTLTSAEAREIYCALVGARARVADGTQSCARMLRRRGDLRPRARCRSPCGGRHPSDVSVLPARSASRHRRFAPQSLPLGNGFLLPPGCSCLGALRSAMRRVGRGAVL